MYHTGEVALLQPLLARHLLQQPYSTVVMYLDYLIFVGAAASACRFESLLNKGLPLITE